MGIDFLRLAALISLAPISQRSGGFRQRNITAPAVSKKFCGLGRRIRKTVTNSGDLDGTMVYPYGAGQVVGPRCYCRTVRCRSRMNRMVGPGERSDDAKELERVRISLQRDRPLGSAAWVQRTVSRLGLQHTIRGEGRPPRRAGN